MGSAAGCGDTRKEPRAEDPDHAPQPKIDAVRAYGCEAVLVPVAEVFDYLQNHGWLSEPYSFVHPWFHRGILTGYGSIALEII